MANYKGVVLMDYKQNKIFKDILEKYSLPDTAKLIQYRNLKEFKYFDIERINPNHIIELYGKMKNYYVNKNRIHVGRIIIPYICLTNTVIYISPISVLNTIILILGCCLISTVFIYSCSKLNIMRLLYDCFNRGFGRCEQSRKRKNLNVDSLLT